MKKIALNLLALLCTCSIAFAQSRVFKEVNNAISSQVSAILQDNIVIGYLAFTRLEEVKADHFNYRITIIDENLDEISTVNFQDQHIELRGIAFEKDVFCIAYFRSNMRTKRYRKKKQLREAGFDFKNEVLLQFLSLNGKIIDSIKAPVDIEVKPVSGGNGYFYPRGNLKQNIRLINIPDHGFACYYGDLKKNLLSIYDVNGKKTWQKTIKEDLVQSQGMIVSGKNLYLLAEGNGNKDIKKHNQPNSHELLGFNIADSIVFPKIQIKDKRDHQLEIFTFENDPATGTPYISGFVKSKKKNAHTGSVNGYSRGYQAGVFTYNITSPLKKDIKETITYWDDASNAEVSSKGYLNAQQAYPRLYTSFRDFEGNTYFTADGIVRKFNVGRTFLNLFYIAIIPANPASVMGIGTRKGKLSNPLLIKQDKNGKLSSTPLFKGEKYRSSFASFPVGDLGTRAYFSATNHDSKQQFLIVTEKKSTSIYNVTNQKLVRTIPLKDDEISRAVLPAKEGYILISEYNKKEKSTRISIEAL